MSSSSLNPNAYEIRLTKGEFTILLESDDLFFASRQLELWYQFFLEAKPVTWGGIMASQLPQRAPSSGNLAQQHQVQQEQLREITDALSELFIDSPSTATTAPAAYTPPAPVPAPVAPEPVPVTHTHETVSLPFESFNEPRESFSSFAPAPTESIVADLPDIDEHEAMLAKLEETQKLQQHRIANPPTPEELAEMQLAAAAEPAHLAYDDSESPKTPQHDAGLIDTLSMPVQPDTETLKAMPATPEPLSESSRAQLINTIQQPVENIGISVEYPPSMPNAPSSETSQAQASTPPVDNSAVSVDNPPTSDMTPDPATLLNANVTSESTPVAAASGTPMAVLPQDNTDFEQILDAALTDMSADSDTAIEEIPLSSPEPVPTPEPVMAPSPLPTPAPAPEPEDEVETLYIDSFKDLSELMPANTDPSQWAMLAGYFMQQLAGQPAFTLKDVNVQMAECNLGAVNHSHLQTLLSQQWLEVLPDKTGTALATDYRLTDDGVTMAEEMLNVV